MDVWKKIKALDLWKNRKFQVVLCIEIFLIIIGVIGLFGKNDVYNFGEEYAHIGADGVSVEYSGIALPKGVYDVSLFYDTDTNMLNECMVTDNSAGYSSLFGGVEHLYATLHNTDFKIWLLADEDNLSVTAKYCGSGSMTVHGLEISETNALNRMYLFGLIVAELFLDVCIVFRCYDKAYGISGRKKNVIFGLGTVTLFASLPLMTDAMMYSGDLVYHLMRIEGITDGILQGQFPVRIAPEWLQGYGYASSIFYGETVLYIAALFRLIGFSVTTSYKMFLFVVTLANVLIAFHCFKRMFKDEYIGLICSAIYTLSVYRVSKTYGCGSLGETLGILFLPLIVYGFYRVFTEDSNGKGYGKTWVPLTVGFVGIVQSHFLTGELVGFFTIILCIILWKKVFVKNTFIVLAKTVIYTVLLSAWFLVPFLDYMLFDDFVIKNVSERTIQNRGLYLPQLLYTYFENGTNAFFSSDGLANAQPMGVGIVMTVMLFVWLGILFFRKASCLERQEQAIGKITASFAMIAMTMSLTVFPWDRIQSLSSITKSLVSSIQFPNRLLTIAVVMLTALTGIVAKWVMAQYNTCGFRVFAVGIVAMVLISSIYLTNDMLYKAGTFQVNNPESMATGYIAGGEYVPMGTDVSLLVHRGPLAEENIIVEAYEKQGLQVELSCHNASGATGTLELPLLYYRGYRAYDVQTGEAFTVCKGSNNVVGVEVPGGYQGMLRVEFCRPWYWRVAEILSVLMFAGLVAGSLWQRRKAEYERDI